jgi:recombination protein RecA
VLDLAVEMGIAKKSGAWFTYDGEQLGQGRENSKQFLIDNPDVMMQMSARVREKAMALPVVEAPAGFSKDDEEPIELE